MKEKYRKKWMSLLLIAVLSITQLFSVTTYAADISDLASESRLPIVLTLGADLSEDQKNQILQYFGIEVSQVTAITITNQDEKEKLGNLISAEQIGSRTVSCALVNPTNAGGIQVKTANMNYVTSNMIAGQLSTSGVYNCEVLTAAPFEVSGTGALTGVMMAYEEASGVKLEEGKKELANVELITTGNVANTVGQDQATLIVNDIKIHIVRDQISEEQEVHDVVDDVITTTETAAEELASAQGQEAPQKLGEVEHTQLYDFSYKFSQMDYDYSKMQPTLERVTHNITTSTGIDDPITDTFTTITEDQVLPSNSILLGTNDKIWGDDANINATNMVAVADRPAEPIDVYSGEVMLTSAGGIKADEFISGTNIISYKDVNGSYALMDLNGKLLTDSIYTKDFRGSKGYIEAMLNDGTNKAGVLAPDGSVVVDFQYDLVKIIGNMWAVGVILTEGGTEDDYDYKTYDGAAYYLIDYSDFYFLGTQGTECVGKLTRDEYYDAESNADYINVQARSGVITTYDSSFAPVQTTDQLHNFDQYDYDKALRATLEEKTGNYVSSFYGKYAQISDGEGKGIVDRYGNIIVPMQFSSFVSINDSYEAGGYFTSIGQTQTVFVTAGGNVTGSFNYGTDSDEYVTGYGMTAMIKKNDGGYILLSADGVETVLDASYSYLSRLDGSKGLLWVGETGSGDDLIDWHGNVLLSGSAGYSISSNGKYLIAQDGYTSSTLYMIDDAEPVKIADSAGGAQELEVEIKEGASLEKYEGDPQTEKVSTVLSESFIEGTDLLRATNDGEKYAVMDVTDNQLTEPQFRKNMEYDNGWISVQDAETQKYGVISQKGQMIIPCEFDQIKVLNESWIIAYTLESSTQEDYDFQDFSDDSYYQINKAKVYHIGEDDLASVEVTRDQLADAQAEGEYINIQNRTDGTVTTYDSSFNVVATVNDVYDFGDFSYDSVLYKQMQDKTEYSVNEKGDDGYLTVYDQDESGNIIYGVIDMSGEVVVPLEYDRIERYSEAGKSCISTRGYICVIRESMAGYVTKGGEVTCEPKYERDNFITNGMSGTYKKGDGTYLIVAADGTESGPYPNVPRNYADGLFYAVTDINGNSSLVDWHGNEVIKSYYNISFAQSGKYFIVQEDYDSPSELYVVDGAEVIGVGGNKEESDTKTTKETEKQEENSETDEEKMDTESETDEASGEEILQMLQSVKALLESDFDANKTAIETLLKQAETKSESEYSDVSTILNSAESLLETGDADTIATLVDSAMSMVQ